MWTTSRNIKLCTARWDRLRLNANAKGGYIKPLASHYCQIFEFFLGKVSVGKVLLLFVSII